MTRIAALAAALLLLTGCPGEDALCGEEPEVCDAQP